MDIYDEPYHVGIKPLQVLSVEQREGFEEGPRLNSWPEVGSRWMQRSDRG